MPVGQMMPWLMPQAFDPRNAHVWGGDLLRLGRNLQDFFWGVAGCFGLLGLCVWEVSWIEANQPELLL